MTFGERLVELRVSNGFTKRNEFADKLGIPSTTLRNYETGVREPGHTFLKQISEYFNVSVDYLLGLTDDKEILSSFRLKTTEYDHIKKYRDLDPHGKDMVDTVLTKEHARWEAEQESSKITAMPEPEHLLLNAAHARTDIPESEITPELLQQEEDIMDDENF